MKSIGNFGGTLYFKEVPVAKFKFEHGELENVTLLTDDKRVLPILVNLYGPEEGIIKFFEDRCTPETRIGFNELLAKTPIQYYSVERLLRWNHAQCAHDRYWVRQDKDNRCWDDSPLEGVGVPPNEVWSNLVMSKCCAQNEEAVQMESAVKEVEESTVSQLIESAAQDVDKRYK